MKTFLFVLLSIFMCQLNAQETKMTSEEATTFKVLVQNKTKAIRTIQTDFKQEKHLSFLSNDIASSGKMYLTAEGKLKWAYLTPNKYSITFNKNSVTINDNGKKNTVSGNQKMFQKLSHLIAGSISGKLFNDVEFIITYFKSNNYSIVKLIPKDATLKKYIKEVKLFFPKGEGTVAKVKLIEPSGDYTSIQFVNKKINAPINPNVFTN